MKTTTKRQQKAQKPATPGFAIAIDDDTELGLAMLIAEDEEGHYQPVGCVVSINEAREIAQCDFSRRMRDLERGADPGLCPYVYKIWATGLGGEYRLATELLATSL
jgi:hypothetical protein